jgi:hypothetical protein
VVRASFKAEEAGGTAGTGSTRRVGWIGVTGCTGTMAGGGGRGGGAGVSTTAGFPQRGQNFAPSGIGAPQFVQY